MESSQTEAIKQFRVAVQGLQDTGVIRSSRILGDLGEFLCADHFKICLEKCLREKGFDGLLNGEKVQIKYHGGKSTTVNIGNPKEYKEVFIVLGPESVLREGTEKAQYIIYRLSRDIIRAWERKNGRYYCTKRRLPDSPAACIYLE